MIFHPTTLSHISGQQIDGPREPRDFPAWLAARQNERRSAQSYLTLSRHAYDLPQLAWCRSSFVQPQMMVEDRYFYDAAQARYTVDRYLDDLEERYGGIDSVLIWMMYPNIGIDHRNQFDHLRDMPGGLDGVRGLIADFHRRGVRVLLPIKPWDLGTRDEGRPMWEAWARLAREVGADGLNGDTFAGVPHPYWSAGLAEDHPLALEPENGFSHEESSLDWNVMSWGYWKHEEIPSVSRSKWIEPRHLVHLCQRWSRDKTHDLQAAFFNGLGIESWENVWGIWNGITPRDGETIRRIYTLFRSVAGFLSGPGWEPHTPTLQAGVYASRWPGQDETLWTLVNRYEHAVTGEQLQVAHVVGTRYHDLWRGREVDPQIRDGVATLSFELEPRGYGAILATPRLSPTVATLKTTMEKLTQRPLASFSSAWQPLLQRLVEIPSTPPADLPPDGMVAIAGGPFTFQVSGVMVEGGDNVGTGVQFPWEDAPRRHHRHVLDLPPFFIDRTPVTNAQFATFLEAARYRPADPHNFLRDWIDGQIPSGWDDRPVTWVSLEDARAYAAWAGKRLPHDWEWARAAGAGDGRTYPWGSDWRDDFVPTPHLGRDLPGPFPVTAHPAGASPHGVMDLVGNVWQFTDEFHDEHTRAVLLRGGSYYRPQGSGWYFPQALRLDQHGKYLLLAPSRDRAGTLGFRCVVDASIAVTSEK